MGGTQNELSQFGELQWIKCGEIKMCVNRNDFQLSCDHCSSIFSQMAVFARHLHWEHQVGVELQGKQQGRKDLSIYTVEELLANKNIDSKLSSDTNTCNTISNEDDTGLGSDEELEKEIEELLISMSSAYTASCNDTECSENDSGFDNTKSINENLKSTRDKAICNINLKPNIKRKTSKELDTAENQTLSKRITMVRKDDNGFGKSKALEADKNNKTKDVSNISKKLINTTAIVGNTVNYTKTNTKEVKNNKFDIDNPINENPCIDRHGNKVEAAPKTKQKLPLKQFLESKKFLLQSDDESKNCDHRIKKNTRNETKDAKSNVLVFKKETNKTHINQEKLDNLLNNEDIECARAAVEAQASNISSSENNELDNKNMYIERDYSNILTVTDDISLTDKSIEEEKGDKVNKISITEEIITKEINIKNNVLEMQITDGKHVYEAPAIYDLNGYQSEYINYNGKCDNSSSVEEKTSQQSTSTDEMDIEKPLDLSFNKSDEWSDVQLEEISELLLTNGKDTMELVAEDFDKLVTQQPSNFTDNPTSLFNSDHLQISDIIADNLLPPFSKFFKNNANCLNNDNNFIAQSTPKEKKMKASNATGMSVKNLIPSEYSATETAQNIVENVKTNIPEHKMNVFSKNLQHRFKVLKRVAQCNKKENKSKKRKHEVKITEEIVNENKTSKKPDIEILSVDIILPSENKNQSESTTFTSSNAVLPAEDIPSTKDSNDLQIPSVRQEMYQSDNWGASASETIIEDLIPYVKIKKPTILAADLSSHAAADSTSEQQQPLAYISEIDYTPDNTLNQLKLNAMDDEKLCFNTTMESCLNVAVPCDSQNNAADDSMISTASEEEQDNYTLLRSVGLKIVMNPNAEDELTLERLEEMRAKANTFAKIFAEFKYLWKVGKGIKSYEQLELDFNRLMQRLNEHYKFELTISQTKRIVNLLSLWYMQTYHKWFIEKKRVINPIQHYLNTFAYLPKTTRRIFYCEECPRYFLAQQKYFAHRQGHSVLMPTCANCQSNFANRKELQLHAKVCTTYKCVECAYKFENAANLEYHMRNNHMLQCEKCGKLCATAADLDWHEHQYPIICGLCNRLFDTTDALQKHRQESFHWDYTCRTCDIFLPTATLMKQHLRLCMGNTMQ